jgi:hypothetical protein
MTFPIHARYAHPENGYPSDQAKAEKYLTPGQVYSVEALEVGQSVSYLRFRELRAAGGFNTVMFEGVTEFHERVEAASRAWSELEEEREEREEREEHAELEAEGRA